MAKCVQITVIKKQFDPEMAARYLTDGAETGACPLLEEGQVFIYQGEARMPQGLCPWAWQDIYKSVAALACGGTHYPWNNRHGQTIVCCTDGVRPVTFEVTAIDEEE